MTTDENVERVQRTRAALLERHGGLKGWIKHLQALDRRRARSMVVKAAHRRRPQLLDGK